MKTSNLTTVAMLLSTALAYHISPVRNGKPAMDLAALEEAHEDLAPAELPTEEIDVQEIVAAPEEMEPEAEPADVVRRQGPPPTFSGRPDSVIITFTPPNSTVPTIPSPFPFPFPPPLPPPVALSATCNTNSQFNTCTASRQACVSFPPVAGWDINSRPWPPTAGQCVCQAGYKPATGGVRLAYPGYDFLVLSPPGVPCNTLCTTQAPSAQVCGEVPGPYGPYGPAGPYPTSYQHRH